MQILKQNLGLIALSLAAVFVTSCSSTLKVTTDYDKSVSFQGYKTFSVYDIKSKGTISQLNVDRVVNAIRNEMVKKGFTEVSSNPDLMVNAMATLKDQQSVTANTNYYGYGGMYRPYGYYGGMGMASSSTSVSTYNYKEGTFVIDVVDTKTNKMIWEGVGSKDIDSKPKDPDAAINEGVAKIMAGFPPGMGK